MEKLPISLVIITYNEAHQIKRCIESADFVEDVVVLDSQSTDDTRQIAEESGARVYSEPFRGYREQKKRVTELAKNDWVITLDADEALSKALIKEIKQLFSSGALESCEAFKIKRANYHMGEWIRYGGWFPDSRIRFFNRNKTHWSGGHVHERLEAKKVNQLKSPILHWVFRDISHQVDTNNKYSSLGAHDLKDKGKRFSFFLLIIKPISKFIETYILKRGFMDGYNGFFISVGAAYSVFLKWAKLKELQDKESIQNKKNNRFFETKIEKKFGQ